MEREENYNSQILNKPKAIDIIGEEAFLKLPFYRSKKQSWKKTEKLAILRDTRANSITKQTVSKKSIRFFKL